jgi:hypothetical protein
MVRFLVGISIVKLFNISLKSLCLTGKKMPVSQLLKLKKKPKTFQLLDAKSLNVSLMYFTSLK